MVGHQAIRPTRRRAEGAASRLRQPQSHSCVGVCSTSASDSSRSEPSAVRHRGTVRTTTRWAGSPAASWSTAPRPSAPSSSPSGWAASTPPPKSLGPLGRRCAKSSPATGWACQRATPRPSGSGRWTPPAGAAGSWLRRALTRRLWHSTTASFPSGHAPVGSWPSGPPRRGLRGPGRQGGGGAAHREPRRQAQHPRVGDHPPRPARPPAGRSARQPRRPPPRRPNRPHQPVLPTPEAGDGGRCPLTLHRLDRPDSEQQFHALWLP
jgi:hypothetical protein